MFLAGHLFHKVTPIHFAAPLTGVTVSRPTIAPWPKAMLYVNDSKKCSVITRQQTTVFYKANFPSIGPDWHLIHFNHCELGFLQINCRGLQQKHNYTIAATHDITEQ